MPYLVVHDAAAAIEFYKLAFDVTEGLRLEMQGMVVHAELTVNGAMVYLSEAPDDSGGTATNPRQLGGTCVMLHQYVADVDASAAKAVAAGGTLTRSPEDQFYGDRVAMVTDPFGHMWSLHSRIAEVSEDEMMTAMAE